MKPILFKPEMVRAILTGQKTQTRRICDNRTLSLINSGNYNLKATNKSGYLNKICPYGNVGDILWVRETFVYRSKQDRYYHKADYMEFAPYAHNGWKPSIHMPKRACRLFLKITDLRIERLHDISEEDAMAEGVERKGKLWKNYTPSLGMHFQFAIPSFFSLWESIHGQDSWDENPWLWVVEFEKTEKPNNWPD